MLPNFGTSIELWRAARTGVLAHTVVPSEIDGRTIPSDLSLEGMLSKKKDFIGKRVKVKGEIDDIVMEDRSFILEGDTWFGNDILVVSKGKVMNLKDLADKVSKVTITGTVKHANFYEVENDLDSALNPELELDKKKGVTYILLDDFQSGKMAE